MHVRRLKNGIASVQQIGGTVPFGAVGRVRRLVFLSLFLMVRVSPTVPSTGNYGTVRSIPYRYRMGCITLVVRRTKARPGLSTAAGTSA